MKDQILIKHIKQLEKNFNNKYKLIKDVDFVNDVETKLSGEYIVHPERNYLEFKYQNKKNILPDDYIKILGKIEENHDVLKLVNTLNKQFGDSSYRSAWALIDSKFSENQTDVLCIEVEKKKDSFFYLRLGNQYFYNTVQKIRKENLQFDKLDIFSSDKNQTVDIMFSDVNKVIIARRIGTKIDDSNVISSSIKSNLVKFIVDLNHNYIQIDGDRLKIPFLDYIKNEKMCISLLTFTIGVLEENSSTNIKCISYEKEEGYIYFKTFKILNKKVKVVVMHSYAPIIQYFCEKKNKWLFIKNGQEIYIEKEIQFRIKLQKGNRIYKFLLMEKNGEI